MAHIDGPDGPELQGAALRRAHDPIGGSGGGTPWPPAAGPLIPGGAPVVLLAAHAGDVAAGQVLPLWRGEALEEWRIGAAAQKHEDVVRVGL